MYIKSLVFPKEHNLSVFEISLNRIISRCKFFYLLKMIKHLHVFYYTHLNIPAKGALLQLKLTVAMYFIVGLFSNTHCIILISFCSIPLLGLRCSLLSLFQNNYCMLRNGTCVEDSFATIV